MSVLVHNGGDGFGVHAHGVTVTNQIVRDFPHLTVSLYTFFHQKLHSLPSLAKPDHSRSTCNFYSEFPGNTDLSSRGLVSAQFTY
ncbi:MAG: hypothetical protein H0T62_05655 [Parachlamydiaceae bacterium]|nr:hypothetical protein [Parachlamydiaceae bacterium]